MSYKGSKVLVTGAAGFIGRYLVGRLLEAGAQVTAVDAIETEKALAVLTVPGGTARYLRLDVRDEAGVRQLLEGDAFDTVFHLAAIASPRACVKDFALAYSVNVTGTFNMLHHAGKAGRFVFLSSSAVYGPPAYLPMDEAHPRLGKDPYASTKIMGEDLCRNYAENYGLRCSIVRNFNSFGPYQSPEYIVPGIITQGLRNGAIEIWNADPVRDLMYVENSVDAILEIGSHPELGIYNVGSGRGVRIGDLAQLVAAKIGREIPVRDLRKDVIGSPALIARVDRLRSLGWSERVSFELGIERTVESLRR